MKTKFFLFLICLLHFVSYHSSAQLLSVSGFVKNHTTGEIKPNVAVFESVSGVGTITNREGYYRLLLNPGQQKLDISSPGFESYKSTFNLVSDTIITVKLLPLNLSEIKAQASKQPEILPFAEPFTGKAAIKTKK